jgi:hypothetical protein
MAAPDGSSQPTVGELARGLQAVLVRFEGLIQRIELNYIQKDVYELGIKLAEAADKALKTAIETEERDRNSCDEALRQRIEKLESNQAWLVRTIIGAVVLAVLAGVLVSKRVVGQ